MRVFGIISMGLAVVTLLPVLGRASEPITISLRPGVQYRLIPIRFPDGRVVLFGETEVTNEMWQAYLIAVGMSRRDQVELERWSDHEVAMRESLRQEAIASGFTGESEGQGDSGDTPSGDVPAVDGKPPACPEEAFVKNENDGMLGFSSLRDESLLWKDGRIPQGRSDFPVTFITIKAAHAFCLWLSSLAPRGFTVRLPTQEEWSWAAYGGKRRFPWGDETREIPQGSLYGVKAHPELSTPEGLFSMYGNASEFIYTDSDGYGGRVPADQVPCVTQWMGTDSYDPWSIPRKDYFGYDHANSIRKDWRGFRAVMLPKEDNADKPPPPAHTPPEAEP